MTDGVRRLLGGGAGAGGDGGGASEGDGGAAGQSGQKLAKTLAWPGAVDSDQSLKCLLRAKALGVRSAGGLTGVTHQSGQGGVIINSLQAALEYYCQAQDIEGGAAVYACGRCGGRTPASRQVGVCVCVLSLIHI